MTESNHSLVVKRHKVKITDDLAAPDNLIYADRIIRQSVKLAEIYRESKGITIPLSETPRPRQINKNNFGTAYLINLDETVGEWIDTAAMATTVDTLYDPDNATLPSGRKIGDNMAFFLKGFPEGIALRARAKLTAQLMSRNAKIDEKWLSLACGNALPILNAAEDSQAKPEISLIDFNFNNLRHAKRLAKSRGQQNLIKQCAFRDLLYKKGFRQSQILRQILAPIKVKQLPHWNFKKLKKNYYDRIDIIGFVEYLPKGTAARFLKRVYELLAPGGMIIFDSLSETNPEREFYEGVIQWPLTRFTSINDNIKMLEMSGITIANNTVHVYETPDKVYPIYEIRKPL